MVWQKARVERLNPLAEMWYHMKLAVEMEKTPEVFYPTHQVAHSAHKCKTNLGYFG